MSLALREALASPARLEALYASDLLDPAPDEAFDRLTRMVAGAMGASVACVTAADADWLYFRSQWGFPKDHEPPARLPLDYSVCKHVAATDSPVVLADVRQDPRFRDSPAISEWKIVAYAGVPLHAPGGEAIGTLSAIDHQPREWTAADLQVLLDYAHLLETELASRAELVRRSAAEAALQRSEQRYRQLFDNANDGLVTTDLDGTITDVNESAVRNSGRPREELIGSSVFDLMTGAGLESPLQFDERGASHAEIAVRHPDGSTRFLDVRARIIREDGHPIGIQASARDVTERRELEHRFRQQSNLFDQIESAVISFDGEGRVTSWNRAAELLLGLAAEEAIGTVVDERVFHPGDLARALGARERAMRGVASEGDLRMIRGDGSEVLVHPRLTPIAGEGGVVMGSVAVLFDVTQRRAGEDALRLSQEQVHFQSSLLDQLNVAVFVEDLEGNLTFWNPAAEQLFGWPVAEVLGKRGQELITPEAAWGRTAELRRRVQGGVRQELDGTFLRSDGSSVPAHVVVAPVADTNGRTVGTMAVFFDISERMKAETALREAEQFNSTVISSVGECIVVHSIDGFRYMVWNAAMEAMTGLVAEAVLGRPALEVLPDLTEGFDALMQRAAAGERVVVPDVRFSVRQTGRSGWMNGTFTPLRGPDGEITGVIGVFSDTTERKRTELALIQAQKMESLGVLAGGVAHDFNNLLTAILGFAGLLKRSPGLSRSETDNLNLIENAARRGAELTGRLLAFARGGLVRFVPLDLRDVVAETLQLAEPGMHSNLLVRSEVAATPVMVEGDHGQLQQALLNIVLNARDAMPAGGEITVRLGASGGQAVLVVGDNGPGMSEETRVRIFEPFFTTKPLASGTGLGLAITYGIVQGHGGTITVVSQPGKGSTFTISLPLTQAQSPPRHVQADSDPATTRLLLVDDDDLVRRALGAILVEMGYTVTPVSNGRDAIEAFAEEPTAFSAILLDLVMPGLTGGETFRRLTAIHPDVPIIVVTGYAADDHIDAEMKRRVARLIQKPFTRERLAEALAAVGALPRRRQE